MQKIPVLETVGETYGLAFGRYFLILGIIWLPLVVLAAAFYFIVVPVFRDFISLIGHAKDIQAMNTQMQGLNGRIWLFDAAELVFYAVVSVGITREAFGLRKPPKFFYLRFGADELRVLGGYLMLIAVFMGVAFVSVFAILIAAATGAALTAALADAGVHLTAQQLGVLGGLAIFVAVLALIYVVIRLTYLLVPVTVAEHRFGILRSWELTRGNVLRIVGVVFITLLPMMVAGVILEIVAFMPIAMHMIAIGAQKRPPAEVLSDLWATVTVYLPYYGLAMLAILPVLYGLMLGSPAFAYRALVPAAPDAPASA
jgi:hypothetical protein